MSHVIPHGLQVFIVKNIEVDSTEETDLNHILLNSAKCCQRYSPNVKDKSIAMAIGPWSFYYLACLMHDVWICVRSKDAHKQLSQRPNEEGFKRNVLF